MKQITQRPNDGTISVVDVPAPQLKPGWALVENRASLISVGTERAKLEVKSMNLLQKARARPDLVRKVIDRARVEGVRDALTVARDRLASLDPLGYSSSGVVMAVGNDVEGIAPGMRVACAGANWANHAEVVCVPKRLIATVPDNVSFEDAAYATVGAIALHGVRQSEASIGEFVGVIGLGLVGQLAVRILRAAGCRVVGIDPDARAVGLAEGAGAIALTRDDPALESKTRAFTGGLGLDRVVICAGVASTDPVDLATQLARERGRIVVVGDTQIAPDRSVLYEKELEVVVSRSYGPGRYDREYEEHGRDLPAAYVRWTEQRNLQGFIDLVADRRVDPSELTTHRFPIDRAAEAYALLNGDSASKRPFGVLIDYGESSTDDPTHQTVTPQCKARTSGRPVIGVVGAGAFARATLLPALKAAGVEFGAIATESGLRAADVAARFGFERAVAGADEIFESDDIDAVVIATRHSTHADLVASALASGKHVFVEKPLGLTDDELDRVEAAYDGQVLMVGFNRRYAPLTLSLVDVARGRKPLVVTARVNAGPLSADHWLRDPAEGGRLVGEGCHFVDLLMHVVGSPLAEAQAAALRSPQEPVARSEALTATFSFADGSIGSLVYAGNGDPRLPKERFELFAGGLSAVLDDFSRLETYVGGKRNVEKSGHDKGHRAQMQHFVEAVAGRTEPPEAKSYFESSRATIAMLESLTRGGASG